MTNIKPYTDYETVPTTWRAKTLKIFISAVNEYKNLLEPHLKPNNELIEKEMHKLEVLLSAFKKHLDKTEGDYDFASMNFDGDYLKTLYSILWQYKSFREGELAIEEGKIAIRGALEYKQKEINEIAELLRLPIWQRVERRPLLVDSFAPIFEIGVEPQEVSKRHDRPQNEIVRSPDLYIKPEIVEGFISKEDKYNYKKLISLLEELNYNYSNKHAYASSMLLRAIFDHIPPLLGFRTFNEVVSNYSWGETDKKYMSSLLDFKNEGDDALHRTVSPNPDLLEIGDLPTSIRVNRLLQECIVSGGKVIISTQKQKESDHKVAPTLPKDITISLLDENIRWANFGMRHFVWSSYLVRLKVDNYKGKLPDYVSVSVEAELVGGGKWTGKHFIFEGVDKQDEELRVEEHEQKNVTVFISNQLPTNDRADMPEIKDDTMKLIINTKSGNTFEFPIKSEKIIKG